MMVLIEATVAKTNWMEDKTEAVINLQKICFCDFKSTSKKANPIIEKTNWEQAEGLVSPDSMKFVDNMS